MTTGHSSPSLVVLMYHAIVRQPLSVPDWCFLSERMFQDQLEALAATRRVRRLSDAIRDWGGESSPEPTIAVTFDDGFLNNCTVAFPLLEKLRIPATIFINTAFVGTADTLWFCKVNRAIAETHLSSLAFGGETYDLSDPGARAHASARIQARLKARPHPALLVELEDLCRRSGIDATTPIRRDSPYAVLDEHSIRHMTASGLIDFGAHTHTHAILSRLTPEQRRFEIVRSVEATRAITARPCELFAYPNGRREDYDDDSIAILQSLGIQAAVTAVHGANDQSTPAMELKRVGVGPDMTLVDFKATLSYVQS